MIQALKDKKDFNKKGMAGHSGTLGQPEQKHRGGKIGGIWFMHVWRLIHSLICGAVGNKTVEVG